LVPLCNVDGGFGLRLEGGLLRRWYGVGGVWCWRRDMMATGLVKAFLLREVWREIQVLEAASSCAALSVNIHSRKVPDWEIPGSCFLCKIPPIICTSVRRQRQRGPYHPHDQGPQAFTFVPSKSRRL
jgi:hypothetical protein